MEMRDLQLLVEVVDAGSISGGAQRCGLSLSAASARVAALERRYDVQLLERNRRGVTTTAAGAMLVAQGRDLLERAAHLDDALTARAHEIRHTLRLATNSAASDALPEFMAAALNQMPHLAVEMTESNSATALDAVRDGRMDLAVVSVLDDELPGCQVRALWDDPLVVVGPRGSIPGEPLTLAQALAEPMVGLTTDVPFQRLVERQARNAGLNPTYRIRFGTLAAVCAVASAGVGRAIVPRAVARRNGLADDAMTLLNESWAATDRHAVLVAVDFDALPPVVADFADLLLRHRGELVAD